MKRWKILDKLTVLGSILLSGLLLHASEPDTGQVQLPLDDYTTLLQQATDPRKIPRPAPTGYALGKANVVLTVDESGRGAVQVTLAIDVLEDEWVVVPVLPPGTPVESVTVAGAPVQLILSPDGLAWSSRKAGSYTMELRYKVDATRFDGGHVLPVPLPRAAAINLSATLPGTDIDASVIPAVGVKSVAAGSGTLITATVPTTGGIQVSWRTPGRHGHPISRASYAGKLTGDALVWTGKFRVELFNDESAVLPLLPRTVTLSDLVVDGKEATILVEAERFATVIKGRGLHEVEATFQTPVARGDGPPRVDISIPRIPVSRFDLTLPGRKELTVDPVSNVTTQSREGSTTATVHVPMTDRVSFSWSEAVPEEIRTEVRSNAATYHLAHADEGVLYVRALVLYEVNRGETSVIELLLPPDVQVNRIDSDSGAVADWRPSAPNEDGSRVVSVFLDRKLHGELVLDVHYDRSLPARGDETAGGFEVPLIRTVETHRQKGMVALLASKELTLNPLETNDATKVGENQLPVFVRNTVDMTVAHTFKYSETPPHLVVEASVPEKAQGKFDARVDTLISLGDVTLTGSATIHVNVKSGRIMDLGLDLPEGASLLNLTAPSLRTYRVEPDGGRQKIEIEFTQEMEGQFLVDLTYERILADSESRVGVPTLAVPGAEVEQGRIAVEALSAVEVQPAVTDQLSSLDIAELPRQLILKTTNPILLAYKYVHADPPPNLALAVTRHRVLGVQEAAIDRAEYRTLFTSDGLWVTTADFTVRNSRKQFLRVRLPEDSQVWSAFVDGRPEKPALAGGKDAENPEVLIKIINSTTPFSVQLIFATSGDRIGRLGTLEGALPRPDILVTHSRWDVFLPDDMRYGEPATNMDLVDASSRVSADEMDAELARMKAAPGVAQMIEPLRITVPTAGIHFGFGKLYANQSEQDAWFRLSYASPAGALLGNSISAVGAVLFWLGVGISGRRFTGALRFLGVTAVVAGLAAAIISVGFYHASPTPALVVTLAAALLAGGTYARRHGNFWRTVPTADPT